VNQQVRDEPSISHGNKWAAGGDRARVAGGGTFCRPDCGEGESEDDGCGEDRVPDTGLPRLPDSGFGYNNNVQIVQSPGNVSILYEMGWETRVIPLDGRPHLPQPPPWRSRSREGCRRSREARVAVSSTAPHRRRAEMTTARATLSQVTYADEHVRRRF
jgi:hypothetical protein